MGEEQIIASAAAAISPLNNDINITNELSEIQNHPNGLTNFLDMSKKVLDNFVSVIFCIS
jgi:hypothetical protein